MGIFDQTSAKSEKSSQVPDKFREGSPRPPPELKNGGNDVYRYLNNITSQIFDFRSQFFFTIFFVKVPIWAAKICEIQPKPYLSLHRVLQADFRFF